MRNRYSSTYNWNWGAQIQEPQSVFHVEFFSLKTALVSTQAGPIHAFIVREKRRREKRWHEMANPRRSSYSILVPNNQNPDSISNNNPFQIQPQSLFQTTTTTISSSLRLFLNKPHTFPFLLFFFLLLTWVSLRLQHSAHFSSPPQFLTAHQWSGERDGGGGDSDTKVNLVRFAAGYPSPVAKDGRGWSVDPIALALRSGISGLSLPASHPIVVMCICHVW